MVSQKALDDFKKVWKEEFGEEPSDEVAIAQATNLLSLFNVIYRPIKQEWLDEYLAKHPEQHDHDKPDENKII
jgi:hypothetical protein